MHISRYSEWSISLFEKNTICVLLYFALPVAMLSSLALGIHATGSATFALTMFVTDA